MQMKLILTAVFAVITIIVIILIFKSVRHWSSRASKIMGSIGDMEERIENIEKGMDNIKISTERLIQESQNTNKELKSLQEKSVALLNEKSQENSNKKALPLKESKKNVDNKRKNKNSNENVSKGDLKEQVHDLEKALQDLRRQKEQIESDINARIRD